jgi:hypothetical protein
MDALEQACAARAPELLGVAVDPLFTELHGMAAFDRLTHRIGLT